MRTVFWLILNSYVCMIRQLFQNGIFCWYRHRHRTATTATTTTTETCCYGMVQWCVRTSTEFHLKAFDTFCEIFFFKSPLQMDLNIFSSSELDLKVSATCWVIFSEWELVPEYWVIIQHMNILITYMIHVWLGKSLQTKYSRYEYSVLSVSSHTWIIFDLGVRCSCVQSYVRAVLMWGIL